MTSSTTALVGRDNSINTEFQLPEWSRAWKMCPTDGAEIVEPKALQKCVDFFYPALLRADGA